MVMQTKVRGGFLFDMFCVSDEINSILSRSKKKYFFQDCVKLRFIPYWDPILSSSFFLPLTEVKRRTRIDWLIKYKKFNRKKCINNMESIIRINVNDYFLPLCCIFILLIIKSTHTPRSQTNKSIEKAWSKCRSCRKRPTFKEIGSRWKRHGACKRT